MENIFNQRKEVWNHHLLRYQYNNQMKMKLKNREKLLKKSIHYWMKIQKYGKTFQFAWALQFKTCCSKYAIVASIYLIIKWNQMIDFGDYKNRLTIWNRNKAISKKKYKHN